MAMDVLTLLRTLEKARKPQADSGGFTVVELSRAADTAHEAMRQRVRAAVGAGVLECVWAPRRNMADRECKVPTYREKRSKSQKGKVGAK